MEPQRASVYPFTAPKGASPFCVDRAEGVWLYTPDGRRILDAAGGAVLVNVGHGRAEVAAAYAKAVTRATYVVPPFATEERVRLVERLLGSWLPDGLERCAFTSGGSESMDAAIRLARQHFVSAGRPERWKVIGRDLSYHGTTLATLSIGGHAKRRDSFGPWLVEGPRAPAHTCLRCPMERSYPGCGVACVDEVERLIEREGPETVAAVVAEPIVGSTAGALVPPDEYWPRLSEICRRHGVLLIADEVMTGFGRTGRRFAVEHWGVTPDILVAGKGLTGGYAPMGGIFAREAVVAPIGARGDELMFYTYSAHPGACAAADAVLEILEREGLVERAAEMGEQLRKRLAGLANHPNVAEVRGRGLLMGIELVRDRETGEPFPSEVGLTAKVVGAGLSKGVFFYPGGSGRLRDVVVLGPPLVIGAEEIDLLAEVLEASIDSAVARATAEQGVD